MGRVEEIRQAIEHMNARNMDADIDLFSENVKFHAPGLGQDLEGRDAMLKTVRSFVEGADIQYDLQDVVEHGPFAVTFLRSTGNLDGERKSWDLCQVARYEGDKVAELWALRGGPPQPAGNR